MKAHRSGVSCFCRVRQLNVQVHLLDMTLVCWLTPNPTLDAESQARKHQVLFLLASLWYDHCTTTQGLNPLPPNLRADTKTTRPLGNSWVGWMDCNYRGLQHESGFTHSLHIHPGVITAPMHSHTPMTRPGSFWIQYLAQGYLVMPWTYTAPQETATKQPIFG